MKTKKTVKICLFASLIAGTLGAVLRTVALLLHYSTESGHFTNGNAGMLPAIGWGTCIAGALACALLCLVCRKGLENYQKRNGKLCIVASVILVCAILTVIFEALAAFIYGSVASRAVNMIIAVSAVASCVVIFTNAFFPIKDIDLFRAGISVVPAVFVIMPGYRLYFDGGLVMNSPNKNVFIIAACFAAAMMIYESRFHTELRNAAIYVAACCGTVIFGIFSGVPNLIYSVLNGGVSVINSLASDLLVIGFAVFAVMQLVSVCLTKKKHHGRR